MFKQTGLWRFSLFSSMVVAGLWLLWKGAPPGRQAGEWSHVYTRYDRDAIAGPLPQSRSLGSHCPFPVGTGYILSRGNRRSQKLPPIGSNNLRGCPLQIRLI